MVWWIWVLIAFALLAIEMGSTTLHVGLFAVGALVVALLQAFGVGLPLSGQVLVFTLVSLAALFFLRPWLMLRLRVSEPKRVDSMLDETAIALDDIAVGAIGKAEMRGAGWSARNVGMTPLARGERCAIEQIDGLVLHVRAVAGR
jgi:membrane protein implicated in regulation of membrane protease activity